ncbi:MAG TPA: non-homologous end-joining DNA ligase [Candidatus Saccharimonadales bacterium]|nr:non-homologous end-joining DNA ligase [Candidatus Saccharimonadales bacterium]
MDKLELTNLDKIFWPELNFTKGDLVEYYQAVAPTILKYLKDRPESLLRQPNGIHGEGFFQKNFTHPLPDFTKNFVVHSESTNENVNYLVCNNEQTLIYMVQLGCIEINPWNSRIQSDDKPDWAVMDLDPDGNDFKEVVKVAKAVQKVCTDWKVKAFPKTSGKSGIHIYVPLGAKYTYAQGRQLIHLIGIEVNKQLPKLTSLVRSPSDRKGKIYLDYLQNSRGQTLAAPYSARPTKDASVSAPLDWSEVTPRLRPSQFTIKNMPTRIKKVGDLWQGVLKDRNDIAKILKSLE